MIPRIPTGVMRAGQLAVAIGLLALLWRVAGGPEAARALATSDPRWLAAALAALTLQTVLSALRWKITAAQLGIFLGTATAMREYYLAQIVNQSVPGGVLGDAGRAVRARAHAGLLASGQAVLLERLAGQAGLFMVTALAFAVTLARPGGIDWPAWLIAPVGLFIAGVPAMILGLFLLSQTRGRLGGAIRSFGQAVVRALLARSVIWRQCGLSIGTVLCNLVAFGFCAQAVGHGLSPAAITAFVPLILMAMLVPLTISGWGVREGAAALFFPLAGSTASGGLAASVAFGLMVTLAAMPGAFALVSRRSGGPARAPQDQDRDTRAGGVCIGSAAATAAAFRAQSKTTSEPRE